MQCGLFATMGFYFYDFAVEALNEIAAELGKKGWNFTENPCNNRSSWFTPPPPPNVAGVTNNSTVTCNCSFPNGECHIDGMWVLLSPPHLLEENSYSNFLKHTLKMLLWFIDLWFGCISHLNFSDEKCIRYVILALYKEWLSESFSVIR